MRARTAVVCAVVCDLVMLLGAAPLMRYSLAASRSADTPVSQLLLLLLANLVLLAICLCGAGGWIYAAGRLGRAALRAFPRVFDDRSHY